MTTEITRRLLLIVAEAGSQQKAAKKLGISQPYLGELLRGTRQPGPKVLRALGLQKEVTYREQGS